MNPEEEGLIPPKPSVKAPANFTSPDELYKELEDSVRKYHPSDDLSLIRKAYEVALTSHGPVSATFLENAPMSISSFMTSAPLV